MARRRRRLSALLQRQPRRVADGGKVLIDVVRDVRVQHLLGPARALSPQPISNSLPRQAHGIDHARNNVCPTLGGCYVIASNSRRSRGIEAAFVMTTV